MEETNKPHRQSKRRVKDKKTSVRSGHGQNPKAFAPSSGRSLEKRARRKADLDEKRLHVPLPDRSGDEQPPIVVVIAGPPKCGKSTLIRSLVKRYTKHSLGEIKGPVTVVSGNKRRYVFIECSSDLNQMVDLAKIADLVILVINIKNGFEMETFEFLNILQTHGFPKVIGIMTHLDLLRDNKALKTRKRLLKRRFWTEVYDGAKLFYLTRISNNKYFKSEIAIICRFMSVVKFRPLIWRNTHSYALIDRVEDATSPETVMKNEKCDRLVYLYGYNRGANLRMGSIAHVPGVGDGVIEDIKQLEDPCPFPDKKCKMISDKHRILYAPHSDVSGIRYDSDAVYISVPEHPVSNGQNWNLTASEGAQMLTSLHDVKEGIHEKMKDCTIKVFSDSEYLKASEVQDADDLPSSESDGTSHENSITYDDYQQEDNLPTEVSLSTSETETPENYDKELSEPLKPQRASIVLKRIYEVDCDNKDSARDSSGEFFTVRDNKKTLNTLDTSKIELLSVTNKVEDEALLISVRNRFITASLDEVENEKDQDREEKDLDSKNVADNARLRRKFDMMDVGDDDPDSSNIYLTAKEEELKRKQKTREKFGNEDLQTVTSVLGYTPGKYVRFTMRLPYEFIKHYNPNSTVIVGIVGNSEESARFIHVRIKRHRWYKKTLKTNDPLIFSIGWRRFQSLPIYYINDTVRNRYLKYTPEHMYCYAAFYGYGVPPNTGLCAFQSIKRDVSNFRISATGVVLDVNASVNIVKKLKLVGIPSEIHKNTAFIKDMFNSALEVAKFEGISIRTVSGIRGQIKKHVGSPEGRFRATFEDKILMSDIVFLKAWYPVEPTKFLNPVTNMLFDSVSTWQGIRTTSQIRHSMNLKTPSNPDSVYRTVVRKERRYEKLKIPKSLQKSLPFASKPKLLKKRKRLGLAKSTAIIVDKSEKKVRNIVQQVISIAKYKEEKRNIKAALARKG